MALGDGSLYNIFPKDLGDGVHDFSSDTIKCALLVAHTIDIDNDTQFSDVSGDEMSGTGYTAGGVAVTISSTVDTSNDRVDFDCTNPSWAGLNAGTASHAVWYNDTSTNDKLICYVEWAVASDGSTFTIPIDSAGLFRISVT